MNIYITIKTLHLLFEIDQNKILPYLNSIKEVTHIFVDLFVKKYKVKGKLIQENEDLLENLDKDLTDESFENNTKINFMKNYFKNREFLVISLRILATNLSQLPQSDQDFALEHIFLSILENCFDFDLKLETINIIKILLISDAEPQKHHV